MKIIVGKNSISLTDKDYVAKGGQGTIYNKNGIVYKIYHDINGLIPENKLKELQILSSIRNVVIPKDSIYDATTHERIGFTMPFIQNTEYLCKLFVASFKDDNKISNDMIIKLVENMQTTLQKIHDVKVVVGDYNEMNFLLSNNFAIPYYIDVDSYQTASYRCNAIMESVRDPIVPCGTFNDLTDWYSWAIVTFQLYTGIHPFKGKHPDYKNNELTRRMKDSISVFDKNVSVPKFITYTTIPKNQLDWYKEVFTNKHRSIPPLPNAITPTAVVNQVIDNTVTIDINKMFEFSDDILDVVYHNLSVYALVSNDGVYKGSTKISNVKVDNGRIVFTIDGELLVITKVNDNVDIYHNDTILFNKNVAKIKVFNNMLYEVNDNGVIQYSFEKIGKIKMLPNVIAPINYNSCNLFNGVFVDDIYGKITFIIPYGYKKCARIKVAELTDTKIWDAKKIGNFVIVIYSKKGIYNCGYFKFDNTFTTYECKIEDDIDFKNVNVVIKDNGVVIFDKDNDTLELFTGLNKSKIVGNSPISNNKLVELNKTCFINKNVIYSMSMK